MMFNNSEMVSSPLEQIVECLYCGHACQVDEIKCPGCGRPLPTPPPNTQRIPDILPIRRNERQGIVQFMVGDTAQMHLVGTPIVVDLPLEQPLVLGRKILSGSEAVLDLSDFNAFQRGVSRRHCQLYRQNARLIVIDLGSSNGSFLNDERMLPFTKYMVAHNDCLILGTLRLQITFNDARE